MRHIFTILLAVGLDLFLLGCSSLHGKAEELMKAEAYEEAAIVYEEILTAEPGDEKAVIGLKKCRGKIVDEKLIEIRRSRMAGNSQNSVDMLLTIIKEENEWSFYPKGPLAYTQEEETREATSFLAKLIRSHNGHLHPLTSQLLLEKYKPIFQGAQLKAFETLNSETVATGRKVCGMLSHNSRKDLPYIALFSEKFCSRWGDTGRTLAATRKELTEGLYGTIDIEMKVKGVPDEAISAFEQSLESGFKTSPWYSAEGSKTIIVRARGSFQRTVNRKHEVREHSYTISVPYVAYEPVLRTRSVPYQTTQYQCVSSSSGGQYCGNVPTTDYRTEFYTEQQPVTRYRKVPQSKPYDGDLVYQFLFLSIRGETRLGKEKLSIGVSEKDEKEDFEHHWNLPEIGLYAKNAAIPDPLEWLKVQAMTLATEAVQKSSKLWEGKYCVPLPGRPTLMQSGEQVHRCLRMKKDSPPEFVNRWYENYFGVTYSEANKLLGLADF